MRRGTFKRSNRLWRVHACRADAMEQTAMERVQQALSTQLNHGKLCLAEGIGHAGGHTLEEIFR